MKITLFDYSVVAFVMKQKQNKKILGKCFSVPKVWFNSFTIIMYAGGHLFREVENIWNPKKAYKQ